MNVDRILSKVTAHSGAMQPHLGDGGQPEYSAAEISLIASAAPHMAFHAMMAKYAQDPLSLQRIAFWTHNTSLTEWFLNPRNQDTRLVIGQVNALVELAVMSWAVPHIDENASVVSRAAFVGANKDTFRRRYGGHFVFLLGELGYLEQVGRRAIDGFLRGSDED